MEGAERREESVIESPGEANTTSKTKTNQAKQATNVDTSDGVADTASSPLISPTPSPPWFTPIKRRNEAVNMELPLSTEKSLTAGGGDDCCSSSSSDSLTNVSLPLRSLVAYRRVKRPKQHDGTDSMDCTVGMIKPINFDDLDEESIKSDKATGMPSSGVSTPQAQSSGSTNASTPPSSAHTSSSSSNSLSSTLAATEASPLALSLSTGADSGIATATGRGDSAKPNVASTQLLQWKDMPKYLQFNPYVVNGYRPLQPFKGCLLSLFHWHNETVNIFTHAIPIFYILAVVPGLMPWSKGYRFLSFCHLFGSVAPWCGSFLYHLFMNIENGEQIYYTLLKLDMLGIWVSQSFGALPLITATTFCFRPLWKWFIILSYCVLSLWGLYKALTAKSPWGRRMCFVLPFTMRSILTYLRVKGLVGGSHMALSHVYLQLEVDGVSILGGAIGALRIPEKWFPGHVDFYLNSHNIMHVLVVVAVYSMHKATIKDFDWMATARCDGEALNATSLSEHTEL